MALQPHCRAGLRRPWALLAAITSRVLCCGHVVERFPGLPNHSPGRAGLGVVFGWGRHSARKLHVQPTRSRNVQVYPGLVSRRIPELRVCRGKGGAPGRIRTCDLPLRRRTLYPAELRAPDGDKNTPADRRNVLRKWCARRDLNPRPTGSKPGALSS